MTLESKTGPFVFHYKFTLADGSVKEFKISLDRQTLALIPSKQESYPDWTRLGFEQCPNCPLEEKKHPRCPVAANLTGILEFSKNLISHEEADVEITTEARTTKKKTGLQYGISSMMGIVMTTSGCPILDKLRPMVRTHVPFASIEETIYRMLSMYLLAQYFLGKRGQKPDWELKDFLELLKNIEIVNEFFWKRIKGMQIEDAGVNAITHLDIYARFSDMILSGGNLEEIARFFRVYWEKEKN